MLSQVLTIMHHWPAAPIPGHHYPHVIVHQDTIQAYQMTPFALDGTTFNPRGPPWPAREPTGGPQTPVPLFRPRRQTRRRDSYPPGINMDRPEIFPKNHSR